MKLLFWLRYFSLYINNKIHVNQSVMTSGKMYSLHTKICQSVFTSGWGWVLGQNWLLANIVFLLLCSWLIKSTFSEGYDVPILNRYFDWIAVMTYDYHGHWDKKTGHVAPMFAHPDDDEPLFNTVSDRALGFSGIIT